MDTYYPEPIVYREDSLANPTTGAGVAKYDPNQSWEVSWQNVRSLNRYQQSALCNIGLVRKIVYTLPKASCRKWGTVTLDGGNPKTVDELNRALLKIPVIDAKKQRHGGGFKKAVNLALGLAFKTGNGAIILDADDGKSLYEPLDLGNLRKIKSLRVASKWQISPYTYDNSGPSYSHYQIFSQGYYSLGDAFGRSGTVIHRSRVFWFTGIEEDDEFIGNRFSMPGTDRSMLDLIVDAFLEYYGGIKGAGRMIADFDVIVHKIKGLAEMVQADCDEGTESAKALVAQTAARNARTRSTFRSYIADAEDEAIEHITRQAGGYNDLLETLKTYLQANTPYPPAVLFGQFSAGLTASGEGQEERALWNETVSELQEDKISPNLISLDPEFVGILGVVMAQQDGPTKGKILDDVGWQWHSLYDPTPQQQAALEKERATIIQTVAALDPRFTANAILSNYGGQEFQPVITLTDEYKAALEAEARLEKEPPGQEEEGEEAPEDEAAVSPPPALNAADGGTEDDVDLTEFAEFIDFGDDRADSTERETDELFPRMDARKSKLKVGDTKSKNGKTYVFNENRRWALKREGKGKPKAKRKASSKSKKRGPQPGDTKQSKSGKTMVFNGETRRWRLQKPEDVKQAKADLKKAVEEKGSKLTPSEARGVIEGSGGTQKAGPAAPQISLEEYKRLDLEDKQLNAPGQAPPPANAPLKGRSYNPHAIQNFEPKDLRDVWVSRRFLKEHEEGTLPSEFDWFLGAKDDKTGWTKPFSESGMTKAAYKRVVKSALEAGFVPADKAWVESNLKAKGKAKYDENKKELARKQKLVKDYQKALDHPLMTDEEAKGYKATLTEKESQEYTKGSYLGDITMYHGNSTAVVDSIRNEGSKPELNTSGIYGQGTYFAALKHTAEEYASAIASRDLRDKNNGLISVKAKVKNPYVATTEELDEISQSFSGGIFGAEQSNGINSTALTEYMKVKGHDSIYLKDQGYLVSFDGRQTVTFRHEDYSFNTPAGQNAYERHRIAHSDPNYGGLGSEASAVNRFFKDSNFAQLKSTDRD